ncbi:MAG: DUF2135 domain-containing protein, partial [bacterium]|nr:DUF2135 domain-containing protein [bacterium]
KKYEEEITGDAEYEKEKLEDIVTLWQERVDWWEKDFKVPELPPKRKKNAILREVGRDRSTVREVTRESSTVREVTRERNTESETAQNSQENRRQSGPITFSTSIPIEQTLDAGKGRNSVYGVVMLEDGCVIPGAKITLSKDNLNLETVTTEQGLYGIKGLPRGSYTIKAELEGFGSETVAGIHLQGGKKIKMVPIFMEPGTIKQEIVITFSPKDIAMMSPDIILKPWDPDTPYIEKIKKAGPKGAFDIYMKLKKEYGDSPAFYLDCSDYFCKQNRIETGLQILSNIAELELSDAFFLRAYGHRLAGLGLMERSVECFREVLATKPEEPQSYRDLALVLARMKQYKEAVELLYKIVTREWLDEESYPDIEIIALMEINRIIAKAGGNINFDIDARFIKLLDVDIRIVLTWGSADTDIDLYIEDPNGEQSDFKNTLTRIGGLHSKDNTGGYGPEEYVLKRAIPGKYIIEGDYFGSDADKLPGPVTLNLDFFTNYGRKNEEKKSITLRLSTVDETIVIGEIIF